VSILLVTDRAILLFKITIDGDRVPRLRVPHIVDLHIVVLTPKERNRVEALAQTGIASGSVPPARKSERGGQSTRMALATPQVEAIRLLKGRWGSKLAQGLSHRQLGPNLEKGEHLLNVRVADVHVSQLSRENDEALGRALESARCD
jgi:hypothetical protein